MFQVVSLILYHFVLRLPLCFSSCKDQASVQKTFVPSTEVDDGSRSWPSDQSVHTSKSEKHLLQDKLCWNIMCKNSRLFFSWKTLVSDTVITTFIIVVSGVNVFAHRRCTGDPGSGIEHQDSMEWLAHFVHFPTEKSQRPKRSACSHCKVREQAPTSGKSIKSEAEWTSLEIAAPKFLFNSNSTLLFRDILEFNLFRLIPLWLMQLPFHSSFSGKLLQVHRALGPALSFLPIPAHSCCRCFIFFLLDEAFLWRFRMTSRLVGSPMGLKGLWKAPVCLPLDDHRTYPCLQEAEASFPSPTWKATSVLWNTDFNLSTKTTSHQSNFCPQKSIQSPFVPDLSRATLHAGSHRHVICQHVVQVQVSHLLATQLELQGILSKPLNAEIYQNLIKSDELEKNNL